MFCTPLLSSSQARASTRHQKSMEWTNCQLYTSLCESCSGKPSALRVELPPCVAHLSLLLHTVSQVHGQLPNVTKRVNICRRQVRAVDLRGRVLHEVDGRQSVRGGRFRGSHELEIQSLPPVSSSGRNIVREQRTLSTCSVTASSLACANLRIARNEATRMSSSALDHSDSIPWNGVIKALR